MDGSSVLDVAVDADHDPLAAVDLALVPERRLAISCWKKSCFDRGHDTAELLDPLEVVVGLPSISLGQLLDEIAARRADRSC